MAFIRHRRIASGISHQRGRAEVATYQPALPAGIWSDALLWDDTFTWID